MRLKASDIRIWILVALAVRLIGIHHPPLEVGHNWRQSTVCMVARNYHEQGIDLLHPAVDMAGEKSGITGMEFPLLNALMAGTSNLFGYQHWYGRLIVLLLGSMGVWCFFLILRRRWGEGVAFPAALTLLVSLWFVYSRKSMPDVFAVSLVLIGVWWLLRFKDVLTPKRWAYYVGGGVFITFGLLSKLPAGVTLIGLAPLFITAPLKNKDNLVILALTPLVFPACWWYFKWVPHLVETYGFWHFFMGKGMGQGALELWQNMGDVGNHFLVRSVKVVAALTAVAGLILAVHKRLKRVLLCFGLGLLALTAIALKAGTTFAAHDYYMVPFVPFMALLVGVSVSHIPKAKLKWSLIAVIAIEGVANQYHDLFPSSNQWIVADLETNLVKQVRPNALIAVNSGENPTPLYFTHRKGWVLPSAELMRPNVVDSLQGLGLEYVLWMHATWSDTHLNELDEARIPGETILQTEHWRLQQLPLSVEQE